MIKPEFVEYVEGNVHRVFCKLCGQPIAGVVDRPAGSGPHTQKIVLRFKRFSTYAEAKFLCNDRSHHVTNGCVKCLTGLEDLDLMTEMLHADSAEQGKEDHREVVKLVAFDSSGSGLV